MRIPARKAILILGLFLTLLFQVMPRILSAQEPLPAENKGVPVRFNERTLFSVYSPLDTYQPAERAVVIGQRLLKLAEDRQFAPDSLTLRDKTNRTEIMAAASVLATVTEADAKALGKSRLELARNYQQTLRVEIERYREERGARHILQSFLFTLLVTVALVTALTLVGRSTAILSKRLAGRQGRLKDVHEAHELDDYFTGHLAGALQQGLNILRTALVLFLNYLYLLFLLSAFPWTRSIAITLGNYVTGFLLLIGNAALASLPNLLFLAIIGFITYVVLKLLRLFFSGIEQERITFTGLDRELAAPSFRLARLLVFALAAVAMFPYIPGSQTPAFQGISVFLGALVTLGSSSVVSNLIAGTLLTFTRPYRVGDRVKIGETVGDVEAKTDLMTRIRTIKNEVISIPNAAVLGAHIINYSVLARTNGLILHTRVTIGYDAPWQQVHALLIAAAERTEGLLKEPAPFVLQTALNDYNVTYEINAYTEQATRMAVLYAELHQHIQDCFNEANVEIMSPRYTALRDGNTVTLPADYRPSDYEAPAFQVRSSVPSPSSDKR